jgi:hypothetical protein
MSQALLDEEYMLSNSEDDESGSNGKIKMKTRREGGGKSNSPFKLNEIECS